MTEEMTTYQSDEDEVDCFSEAKMNRSLKMRRSATVQIGNAKQVSFQDLHKFQNIIYIPFILKEHSIFNWSCYA